jgi:AcrR family transcriptional regulator
VVQAVYAATRAELGRSGYSLLSLKVVAEKAGVDTSTVYRRWPTKASLVLAAVGDVVFREPPPRRRSLREALLHLTREYAAWVESPVGSAVTGAIAAEILRPEVRALAREVRLRIQKPWIEALEAAVERGDLPAKTDVSLIVEILMGAVRDVFVRVTREVDDAFLVAVVDVVLRGALHGGAVARARGRKGTARRRQPRARAAA